MSKTSKLYDQIKGHLDTFEAEHEKNMAGNKAAGSRARKAIGEVKNSKKTLGRPIGQPNRLFLI